MRIPIEKLIDGIVLTLRDDVLPEVASARARGRVWAVLDILVNLRDRVEEKPSAYAVEVDSLREALESCAAELTRADHASAADTVRHSLEVAQRGNTDRERAHALRGVLVDTLMALDRLDAESTVAARAAIESHLSAQTLRDVFALKPSMLTEISKG